MTREVNVADTQLVKASCRRGHEWWVDPGKKDGLQRCWYREDDENKCNLPIFMDQVDE